MSRFSLDLRAGAPPLAAVEIIGGRVSGVCLEERGGRPAIVAHASEGLPEGAVVPAINAQNVHDRATVAEALDRVMERIGRPRRVGLVVADPVAKVSLVRLQQVPTRAQDLEQVIRWQVRKTAPFAIEDAQIGYEPGFRAEDGQDFIVSLARRDVILEYEGLCDMAGAHAGIVDLSTFNVVNAVLASGLDPVGDWLLVNVAPDWESIAIMRSRQMIFFRSRGADGEGTLADLVHQTAMYYEDRLSGAGFDRVLVCPADSGAADWLRRGLSERISAPVDVVDPTRAVMLTDRIAVSPALRDSLAPLVGLVLRTREAV